MSSRINSISLNPLFAGSASRSARPSVFVASNEFFTLPRDCHQPVTHSGIPAGEVCDTLEIAEKASCHNVDFASIFAIPEFVESKISRHVDCVIGSCCAPPPVHASHFAVHA